ncbi:MAG: 50S ribosomal protein L4 [Kiritimatiellae bacterium]|nr:50S ribosomal protein L4 [Kiritimatiellia bacterium]
MATIKMYGRDGRDSGEVEVADDMLILDRGEQAVRDAVVARNASLRAGTASTLRKGEVAGSNKKPWKQKGTGRARAGYRQSPVWRGGGVAFGPHPRDFSIKVNKKVVRLAFRRALSERIADGAVKLVDDLSLAAPKAKELRGVLEALGAPSALIVVPAWDDNLLLSARNLQGVEVTTARNCSVYQVLRYPAIVMTRAAWEELKPRFSGENTEETVA